MKSPQRLLVFLLLCTVAAFGTTITAAHISDSTYQSLVTAAGGTSFAAEGQVGDGSTSISGPAELLLGPSAGSPAQSAQFVFGHGVTYSFDLSYNQGSNTLTFQLGSQTLTFNPTKGFSDIFIRASSVGSSNGMSEVLVDNLFLNGNQIDPLTPGGPYALVLSSGAVDVLQIPASNLASGFDLTGNALLDWDPTGTIPTGDQLNFQISTVAATPEPASLFLLASGLAGLVPIVRRKLRRN